jgi:basic membrane protein A
VREGDEHERVRADPIEGRRPRVGLVLEVGGIHDPYNHACYVGIERAVRELGIEGRVLTPAPREGSVPGLRRFAAHKYDLIIGTSGLMVDALDAVATQFPERRFAIVDAPHEALSHRPRNVQGVIFGEDEAGYLAGRLAARMAALGGGAVISAVGGQRIWAVERFIAGYELGARSANPEITVLTGYTNDFFDPAKGRALALGQIAKGSRVVFQVAGACGGGALEAAGEHGVWAIGVDVDQSSFGAHVLTSAVKQLDVAVFDTIGELTRGTLSTGGDSLFALASGGVGLSSLSPEVPRTVADEIESLRVEIIARGIAARDQTVPSL